MFESRLALLEGAEACKATGTGMAAVFAVMACQLQAGDRVVASRALFGACHGILTKTLPKWGIETVLIDGHDLDAWRAALATPTKLVFFETPSNPLLELVDIAALSQNWRMRPVRAWLLTMSLPPQSATPVGKWC